MEEQSIIKDLYDHFDELNFGFRPKTREYEALVKDRDEMLDKLKDLIPKEAEFILDELIERTVECSCLEEKETYRQGVCFGVKLTAEAFVTNRNRAVLHGNGY